MSNNKISNNKELDLQEIAWADLALAIFIRAFSDYRWRIDTGEGDPKTLQENARKFLFGEDKEWKNSKRFWLRVAGLSDEFFDSFLLPKLARTEVESGFSQSNLKDHQGDIRKQIYDLRTLLPQAI